VRGRGDGEENAFILPQADGSLSSKKVKLKPDCPRGFVGEFLSRMFGFPVCGAEMDVILAVNFVATEQCADRGDSTQAGVDADRSRRV
jgi:hypothetical protein